MHVAHEVAPQRNEEENAEALRREDEDGLPGVRVELEDVEAGSVKIAPATTEPETPPTPVMMTFSERLERRR